MWIASYHAGNGWYLEQSYNYYTISLFVVYGTIWSQAFGASTIRRSQPCWKRASRN